MIIEFPDSSRFSLVDNCYLEFYVINKQYLRNFMLLCLFLGGYSS